jgi:hypothetical protein
MKNVGMSSKLSEGLAGLSGDKVTEPVEPSTPPAEPSKPVEPSTPPAEPSKPVEPSTPPTEPSKPVVEDKSSLKQPPQVPTEEQALKILSEKLGRPLSLEELSTTPLEDPYIKALYEWRQKTGRPIEDWVKFNKDYSKLDDKTVVREYLQQKYPTFDESDIEMELEQHFPQEDDLEEEAKAKKLSLKKLAIEARESLSKMTSSFGEVSESSLTPELKEKVKFAEEASSFFKQNQDFQKAYVKGVDEVTSTLDSISLKLSEDLDISYKLSDEAKKSLPDLIKTTPTWSNEDGTPNFEAIAKDAVKIHHFDEIVKIAFEQGVSKGKDELSRDMKNIPTGGVRETFTVQGSQGKGSIEIEGLDSALGKVKTGSFKSFLKKR